MIIDIIIALAAIFAFMYGYSKGIIRVVFAIAAMLIGGLAALKFTPAVAVMLQNTFPKAANFMPIVAFLVLFLGAIFLFRFVAKMLEGALKKIKVNSINKLAGGVIFSAVCLMLLSSLLGFIDASGALGQSAKDSSALYPFVEGLHVQGSQLAEKIFPFIRDMTDKILDLFNNVQNVES